MKDQEKLIRFLIALGGLVGMIEALVGFVYPRWLLWIGSIFGLIFSLITLLSVLSPKNKLVSWYFSLSDESWILYIVISILLIVFGSVLGGVLVMVAIILDFIIDALD